jgi:hypothetical protein
VRHQDACMIGGVVAIVAVAAVTANHEIKPAGVQQAKGW